MPWFKVDDSFHSHPKAAATSLASIGLWAVAGSWSGDHLTDGFVPDHMIPLLSRGAVQLADELVNAGLWRRTKGGFRYHEWTQANPTREQVVDNREKKAQAGRLGGLASGRTRSKRRASAQAPAQADATGLVEPPTRPSPSTKEKGEARPLRGAARASPQPAHCRLHQGQPAHNCALCRAEALAAKDAP